MAEVDIGSEAAVVAYAESCLCRVRPARLEARSRRRKGSDPIEVAVRATSGSEGGTRVAALFYSLIESAKLCGVEPRGYLREATLTAVRNPGTVTLARDLKSSEC